MTSPTTSADAVKVLAQLRKHIRNTDNPNGLLPAECDALDLAIATLAQHAEAGAVAWALVQADGRVLLTHFSRDVLLQEYACAEDSIRPLIYGDIPAQPASQQGEGKQEVVVRAYWSNLYGCWRSESGCIQAHGATERDCINDWLARKYPTAALPHPTGDKVRSDDRRLIELARRAIGDHYAPDDCYATGPLTGNPFSDLVECPACAFLAALDQEKNDEPR